MWSAGTHVSSAYGSMRARKNGGLDQKYVVKQKERRRCAGSGKRPGTRGRTKRKRRDIETDHRECGQVNGRSRSQDLTRSPVRGVVATSLVMVLRVRGHAARVSVKGPGTDMAHDHQDRDGHEEDRRDSRCHEYLKRRDVPLWCQALTLDSAPRGRVYGTADESQRGRASKRRHS